MPEDREMQTLILHPGLAFESPEHIKAQQLELLRRHLRYVQARSPYYRRRMTEAGLEPFDISNISDLSALPLTSKQDLDQYNQELLCTPAQDAVDLCLTSGTTGLPVPLFQTRQDLDRLGYNEELSFRAAGIGSGDRVLIVAALDRCFMAGLAYFLGLTRIGALAIRGGSGSVPMLKELIQAHRPTAIVGVPSLLVALGSSLRQDGQEPCDLGVQRLICIGEPVRAESLTLSALGQRLSDLWKARIFGTYASTEMATAFTDCAEGRGGHVPPDLILVEILDEQGRILPPGVAGEVVATPLQVGGMPLLRFRTGDIAALHADPCVCGRNTPRLGPVIGRKAQMLKVRGTTVYPPAIFSVLQEQPWVRGYYLEVFDQYELSDRIRVVVGSADANACASTLAESVAARIRVKPEVVLVSPEEVQRKTMLEDKRKPVTFFDFRTTGSSVNAY